MAPQHTHTARKVVFRFWPERSNQLGTHSVYYGINDIINFIIDFGELTSDTMTHDQEVTRNLPLKALDLSVLVVLSEGEEYGYGIVKRIAEQDAGAIRLAPSNLYNVLDRMIGRGLVDRAEGPERTEGGIARQYYCITPRGRAVVSAELERLASLMTTARRLELLR